MTGQQSIDPPPNSAVEGTGIAGLASSPYSSRSGSSAGLGLTSNNTRHDRRNASIDRLELEHTKVINIARRPSTQSQGSYAASGLSHSTSSSRHEPKQGSVDRSRTQSHSEEPISISRRPSAQGVAPDIIVSRGQQKPNRVPPLRLRSNSSLSQASNESSTLPSRDRADSVPSNRSQSVRALPPITPKPSTSTINSVAGTDEDYVAVTSAERSAYALQRKLAPPLSEPVQELANIAREAVFSVVDMTKSHDYAALQAHENTMDFLVRAVAISIRDLLNVSEPAWLSQEHFRTTRSSRQKQHSIVTQEGLKTVRRRITATLAKLVLSARSIQYDTDPRSSNAPSKIRADATDLEFTITTFVGELDGWSDTRVPGGAGYKRRQGIFSNANLGPGLVGAGAAGNWKGMGWVAFEPHEIPPEGVMDTGMVAELQNFTQTTLEQASMCASLIRRSDYGKCM